MGYLNQVKNKAKATVTNPAVRRDFAGVAGLATGGLVGGLVARGLASRGGGGGGGGGQPGAPQGPSLAQQMAQQGPKQVGVQDLDPRLKRSDSSAWLKMQMDKQRIEQQQGVDDAMAQAGSSRADAYDNLAMRGGLSSGARERVAADSMGSTNMSRQNIARQGELSRLGLNTESEKMNKEAEAANIQMMADQQRMGQDQENMRYQEQMKAYGAGQTADAMRDAANKKSPWEKMGNNVSSGWKKATGGLFG